MNAAGPAADPESSPQTASDPAPTEPCPVCGTALDPDQEWCLECGTARTIIEGPPDWRLPVIVVGTIVALAIAGFFVALASLGGGNSVRSALTSPAPTAPGSRIAGGPSPHLESWPVGLDGWTVILAASPTLSAATAAADRLAAGGLPGQLGVINTARHPALPRSADPWQVFDGRYPTRAAAAHESATLAARGQVGATVVQVAPTGGI